MKKKLLSGALAVSLACSTWITDHVFAAGTNNPESQLKEIQNDKSKVQADLKKVKADYDEKKKKLEELEKQVSAFDQQIAQHMKDLEENQVHLDQQQEKFNKMVVRMYENGETHYLSQLVGARTFSEFLHRFESVRLFAQQEQSVLNEYVSYKEKVEASKKKIEDEKEKQAPILAEAQEEYKEVEAIVNKHNSQLDQLEKKEEVAEAAIAEKNRLAREAAMKKVANYGTGVFAWPAPGTRLTSPFGWRNGRSHDGVDLANGSTGSPIIAADSGTVTLMKDNPGGYGYYIVINHGNGLSTLYAHMYRSTVTVSLGQKVQKGQKIAAIGNNGRSTGPHLHFEVHRNGRPEDPMKFIK
ncbi:murein hydrolase activator EnvC family protein [Hazenella coriacea]|uniref:Murein DD-endopeptidase MepM/ murein hydrolase activator NlpD n=1 Tax=Hazenella coriacea TaxID=1179467 RepID=A0A4R3L991_9BACL|nr:M23 family metallopeptidase [Hazenella coriacea]TCS95670.1 murein DD-endopeptidase MepM/ murein hydrolase activator NlpD [Hazenella coriacea]